MKIRLTNPITGKSRIHRAALTTEHCASRYHQPVMLIDGDWVLDPANVVLQCPQIVERPKRPDQVRLLRVWQENVNAMLGAE
jgi:hypothetical protein